MILAIALGIIIGFIVLANLEAIIEFICYLMFLACKCVLVLIAVGAIAMFIRSMM
jgi:hypothetical protein